MPIPHHLSARLKNRDSALKRKKELLSRVAVHAERPLKKAAAVSEPAVHEPIPPKIAAVRMQGDAILTLTMAEAHGPQHLAHSLRQCVDLYLQVAQCGTREIVLLWPGTLECLPLIHAIATIECWAQGYKQGLRAVLYPATSASFRRLNHVFVDREDVHTMNNEVQEVSFNGVNPAVKQKCQQKDLMLFALNSLKENAKREGLQPCINELLPNFLLETGERGELAAQNYGDTYISHILTKLSRLGHAKSLRESTLPELGAAAVAPDAVFALSYRMKKAQIETALLSLKAVVPPNVVLLDATRLAFERVDKLQNRVAAFVGLVDKVFGDKGPGILIVTNDPRQMTYLRATLAREFKDTKTPTRFGATHGLCHPGQKNDLGLRLSSSEPPIVLAEASISVAITDRESAHLIGEAVRIRREKSAPAEVIEALAAASKFVNRMANLPSSSELLHKWLDESAADDAQRRTFDWVAQRNRLKTLLGDLEIGLRGRILKWIEQANGLLESQQRGTPLARAMLDRIKTRPGGEVKVLVVVQSRFYADLAREYFLRDPDSERLRDRVQFTSIRMMEEKLNSNGPTHVIACALSPELLRWAITSTTLPGPVDFLLTQQTAQGASYALEPILGYDSFKPYYSRVHALYDPISQAKGAINAIIPNFDYQAPAFSLTTNAVPAGGHGDRGPTDWVEIEIEDGRRIFRGRGARVYIYDPAARDSRALGFRVDDAEDLKKGDHIFVMSDEMREEVEATFAAAGVTFDEARKYETTLRQYHAQVLQKVRERFAGSVAEAARAICEAMAKQKVTQESQNVRYWINLKHAEQTPFDELMPQAPRHFATFKVFMEVLGFDGVEIQAFWDGAVKRVRGTRISDGLNLGDRYDRVLFDPDAAATYDGLTAGALHTLRARALGNVFEVTQVSLGTVTTTLRRTRGDKIEEQVRALSPEEKQAVIKKLRDELQAEKAGKG